MDQDGISEDVELRWIYQMNQWCLWKIFYWHEFNWQRKKLHQNCHDDFFLEISVIRSSDPHHIFMIHIEKKKKSFHSVLKTWLATKHSPHWGTKRILLAKEWGKFNDRPPQYQSRWSTCWMIMILFRNISSKIVRNPP